jgi:5-hydroxyisourate hydrolase-like protein (transthyretin family)
MDKIIGKLRYHPLDTVAGTPVPITKADLDKIAANTKVAIDLEHITAKNRVETGGIIREETMDSSLEEVSQDVITISSEDEKTFRKAARAIIDLYRAPRTVFGTWGSDEKGAGIISELCDEDDGWY